jgi:hypothetical protein
MGATGFVAVVLGLAALLADQPFNVTYPLLLCGVILFGVTSVTFPSVKRRYRDAELRRMHAMDAPLR